MPNNIDETKYKRPLSVKFTGEQRAVLEEFAKESGLTLGEVIREAVGNYLINHIRQQGADEVSWNPEPK